MHPTRNWYLTRDEVSARITAALGLDRIVWLSQGLAEDMQRDPDRMYYGTDGHIDLFFAFIGPRRALMLMVDDDNPNAAHLARSRALLKAAGVELIDFPLLSGFYDADGRWIIAPYLNFYFCNGAVIVPVAGHEPDKDQAALQLFSNLMPSREVVGIPMRAAPGQGGAVHCLTQQVPAAM
jgi:agmatine deiminase